MTRRLIAASCSLAVACVAVPRPELGSALAAAAGTLFEAAPVLLGGALLPRRLRDLAGLAGCGCGRGSVPGALAPAAVALCWIAFGPLPALARAAAACAAIGIGRIRARGSATPALHAARRGEPADPFGALFGLAVSSTAASLVAAHMVSLARGPVVAIVSGIILGRLAPCASAGIAIAAGFAPHAPLVTATLLATSGIVQRSRSRWVAAPLGPPGDRIDTRFAAALTACALALLVARGPSGFLNPRLLPLVAAGAVAALVHVARRGSGHPAALAVPAVMLAALALGSPQPQYTADETTVATGFPGERATFAGVATSAANGTARIQLVRFAITCCRIDAHPIAVTLDRPLPVPEGTWIRASGTYEAHAGATHLALTAWQRIPPPPDPFVYL